MKNDVLFKNIFLNQACISSFSKIKENLKLLSETVFVADDGEWNYKLNVASNSFSDIDKTNLYPVDVRKVIDGVQAFVELLENISPKDELELQIIKDYEFIKSKYDRYKEFLKSHIYLNKPDANTLENITDFICGDNNDKYPLYRSSSYLTKFFKDIDIDVEHDGSTRKNWVLSVLQDLSDYDLNKVILRLVDIKTYKGNKEDWLKAINSMNDILFLEDLKLNVEGKNVSIVTNYETNMKQSKISLEENNNNFQNIGIVAGGSIQAGGDIIVNGTKKKSMPNNIDVSGQNFWYQKPLGIIIIGVIISLIAGGLLYYIGWN